MDVLVWAVSLIRSCLSYVRGRVSTGDVGVERLKFDSWECGAIHGGCAYDSV